MNLINRLIKEEAGQGLVEYALIVGLVALGCVLAVTAVGTDLGELWGRVSAKLDGAVSK
jgi:pilus assembly protein Flp/PilA